MKLALLADLHFGVRSANPFIWNKQRQFFKDVFFPYCKKNGVNDVLILGDVFDQRKLLNINNLNAVVDDVLTPLSKMNVTILAGNHDTYYKDTNSVNSLSILRYVMPSARLVIDNAEEVDFDGTSILICPWIAPDNASRVAAKIRKTKSKIVMGHFELNGFEMTRGNKCEHGLKQSTFGRFDLVRSGHFHLRSSIGNLGYVGSPYEMDWNDYGSPKGFDVLDTSTGRLSFVKNPTAAFVKIIYSEDKESEIPEDLSDCFVKVIVDGAVENRVAFSDFLTSIQNAGVADVKVVENPKVLDFSETVAVEQVDVDTGDIIMSAMEEVQTDVDIDDLKALITELYIEARSMA